MSAQTGTPVTESAAPSHAPEIPPQPEQDHPDQTKPTPDPPQILAELVVEQISIDGMCGVY